MARKKATRKKAVTRGTKKKKRLGRPPGTGVKKKAVKKKAVKKKSVKRKVIAKKNSTKRVVKRTVRKKVKRRTTSSPSDAVLTETLVGMLEVMKKALVVVTGSTGEVLKTLVEIKELLEPEQQLELAPELEDFTNLDKVEVTIVAPEVPPKVAPPAPELPEVSYTPPHSPPPVSSVEVPRYQEEGAIHVSGNDRPFQDKRTDP